MDRIPLYKRWLETAALTQDAVAQLKLEVTDAWTAPDIAGLTVRLGPSALLIVEDCYGEVCATKMLDIVMIMLDIEHDRGPGEARKWLFSIVGWRAPELDKRYFPADKFEDIAPVADPGVAQPIRVDVAPLSASLQTRSAPAADPARLHALQERAGRLRQEMRERGTSPVGDAKDPVADTSDYGVGDQIVAEE